MPTQRSSLARSDPQDTPATVHLEFRRLRHGRLLSELDQDTWLNLIEQKLLTNYSGYEITVEQDHYQMVTKVTIRFSNTSDAAMFKLRDMK